MNATLARKLRFSDVVYAVNTTPKSLRLWLQRRAADGSDLVEIHTPRQEGGWTEYSFIDIAILALVRAFVNFGVSVPMASDLANGVMKQFFPRLLLLQHPENMPAGAIAMMWHNARLRVHPVADGKWHMQYAPNWDPPTEPAHAYLVIDVESLFREAFERANDSLNEGRDEPAAAPVADASATARAAPRAKARKKAAHK